MKTLHKHFSQLFLIVAILFTFSLSAWGEETLEATFSSDEVVGNSAYQAYSNNYWDLTFGGNNKSGGTNSKNASNCKLTNQYGTQVNINNLAFAITSKQILNNIGKITFTYTGGSNNSKGLIYLAYSTDGTNYTAVTLTGTTTQGSSIGTTNTTYNLEFSPIPSAYYKIIIGSTVTSGNFRFDAITANFYSISASGGETPERTPLATPTGLKATNITATSFTANWDAVTNATSYIVTANDKTQTVYTTSCTFTELSAETKYTYTVVAKGDGENYNDSEVAKATVTTTALPTYTVTLYNGDTQYEALKGTSVNLPTEGPKPSDACQSAGWEFAGWSTTKIEEDTQIATIFKNTYTPSADTKLYAVYKLGEDDEPISITAKNVSNGWEVNETSKSQNYWALFKNNYITTPEISLDNIKSIEVAMGTYGGSNGKTLQIINNSTSEIIATKDATSNNESTKYTINSFTNNTGNAKLKFTSNTTSLDQGLRIKSITINFNGAIYNSVPNCSSKESLATPELNYSNITKFGFTISWESIANADKYEIRIQTNSTDVNTITTEETSYTAGDLTPGVEYTCFVKATNTAGDFYDSEEASINITTSDPSSYTITWNENGVETTTTYTEGSILALQTPTVPSIDYRNFNGWYTAQSGSNLNPSATPQGTKVTTETKPTEDVTYYAVYDNSVQTQKITSNLTDGKYVIRTEEGIYYTGKNGDVGGYSSNIADAAEITITTDGTNFAIFDGTYWLSSPSSNKITFNQNKVTDWILTNEGYIQSKTQTDRFLQYNANGGQERFACYKGTQRYAFLYKGETATAYFSTIETETKIANTETKTFEHNTHLNSLTIYSGKTSSAQIIANETLTADVVTVEKIIDHERWYFFSLPFDCDLKDVVATHSNGTQLKYADSPTTGEYVINYYDQTRNATTNKAWVELIGTNHTLKANQGYIIGHFGEGDVTVKFPSKDAVTISAPTTKTLNYTDSWTAGDVENSTNGWNLIGLPYYQTVGGSLNPTMVSIPRTDGTYKQTAYTNAEIQPFTSFFVQTTEAPTFTIAAQQNAAPMLRTKGEVNKAVVSLADANGVDDQTTIINNPNNTNEYEIGHDLAKWIGYAERPQIYSIQGDDILAFNSLAIDNSTIIPLGVYAHADGEYVFAIDNANNQCNWMLYDNETGATINLSAENYTVALAKGTHEGRFEVRQEQRIATDCLNTTTEIEAYSVNGELRMENIPANSMIYIYDAVGRMIYVTNNSGNSFNYNFTANGVYNIVVRSAENSFSFKTIY